MKLFLGENFPLDLDKLVDTRLLIQANSGGGKSWAIRKLLEVTHGKVQHLVLDIEGEFSTLREKYDYILAGKQGDTGLHLHTAEILAHKMLSLRADLIADLYEFKQYERIRFVRYFLDALINAPKNLWHPVLVVVDEAHIFCPEKGQAESAGAIIDLCTRGRKRGFCGVLATQRLSKLHKDAAAECNNKLIGRTGLDIDIKRALDELGLPASGGKDLRNLEPGEFFAYGPAISRGVIKGRIGKVETTHPKAGHRKISHRPAPTAAIKKVLEQLKDLPKEAEEEAKSREDFQRQIKELKKQLLESGGAVDPKKELDRINKVTSTIKAVAEKKYNQQFKEQSLSFFKTLKASFETIITSEIERYSKEVRDFRALAPNQYEMQKELNLTSGPLARKVVPIEPGENITYKTHSRDSEEKLGRCENAILGFLYAKRPQAFTKVQIGAMTGYAHSSGGFNNALSKLGTIGAIERNQGLIRIRFDWDKVPQDVPHSLDDWVAKLGACERAIYQKVLGNPEAEFEKSDLANMTGYSAGSGGFNNALSRLNTLGLIARQNGLIRLNPEISNI